jgi:FkbM family methyltransferase
MAMLQVVSGKHSGAQLRSRNCTLSGPEHRLKQRLDKLMRSGAIQPNGVQALPDECSSLDSVNIMEVNARKLFGVPQELKGPVIEIGGNVGQDLESFADHYPKALIFSYEPLPYLANYLREYPVVKYSRGRVQIVQEAIGRRNASVTLFGGPGAQADAEFSGTLAKELRNEAASQFAALDVSHQGLQTLTTWEVPMVDAQHVMAHVAASSGKDPEALSLNCEGCEYDTLSRLLETGWLKRLSYVQVSWHLVDIPDRLERRCNIETGLRRAGFKKVYVSYFGWEGWALPCSK